MEFLPLSMYIYIHMSVYTAYQCEYPKWLTAVHSVNTCTHNVKLKFVVFFFLPVFLSSLFPYSYHTADIFNTILVINFSVW